MATVPISDATTRNSYTASAAQTTFPYTFWIKDDDHLDVYKNGSLLAKTTDYTVSATQSVSGGNVVLTSGATEGDAIIIDYNPDVERLTEFQTSGDFKATTLNLELTYLLSLIQYLNTASDRSLKLNALETSIAGGTLPLSSGGTIIGWNSGGTGLTNYSFSSFPEDVDIVTSSVSVGDALVWDGSQWINQKNNFGATSAPTVNDDGNDGYSVGSRWIDVSNDEGYVCLDTAAGAAVWVSFSVTTDDLGSLAVKNEVAFSDLASAAVLDEDDMSSDSDTALATQQSIKAYIDSLSVFSESFTSTNQTITTAGSLTIAHGLSARPKEVTIELECTTADQNYSVGDVVYFGTNQISAAGDLERGCTITADATNIYVRYGNNTNVFELVNKTTGNRAVLDNNDWAARFKAYA